jgi:hypothetical protein
MGIAIATDGALLVGDDSSGVIYRITGSAPSRQTCHSSTFLSVASTCSRLRRRDGDVSSLLSSRSQSEAYVCRASTYAGEARPPTGRYLHRAVPHRQSEGFPLTVYHNRCGLTHQQHASSDTCGATSLPHGVKNRRSAVPADGMDWMRAAPFSKGDDIGNKIRNKPLGMSHRPDAVGQSLHASMPNLPCHRDNAS